VTTDASSSAQTTTRDTARSILVGVDTRGRSVSALVWAVEEAERDGAVLTLMTARSAPSRDDDPVGEHDLGALARRLTLAQVETREVVGQPVEELLRAAAGVDLLALGCRSMRTPQRMMVGSTSHAVARWSPVPVVVVPETWTQPSLAADPIVVGVHAWHKDEATDEDPDLHVLDFAFTRAAALKVPLVVVGAWEIPSGLAWSAEDIDRVRSEYDETQQDRLAPWRSSHPEVEVVSRSVAETPQQALLDASGLAQLVVVGRHRSAALSGLLGSTARGVLRRSTRPVAVIPAGTREALSRDVHRVLAEQPWAPMF
jgi:nucleotide-binding universal stress UspA family protein